MKKKSENFKYFGIYCWHAYPTNPKLIQLLISQDNNTFHSLGNFDLILKPGTQYFILDKKNTSINYLKIVVKETYGGNRVYLNNIFLFDEINLNLAEFDVLVSNSRESNMPRKSQHISAEKKQEILENAQTIRSNVSKSELNSFNLSRRSGDMSNRKISADKNFEYKKENSELKRLDTVFLISDSDLTSRKGDETSNYSDNKSYISNRSKAIKQDEEVRYYKHVKEKSRQILQKNKSIRPKSIKSQNLIQNLHLDESAEEIKSKVSKNSKENFSESRKNSELNQMSVSRVKHEVDNDAMSNISMSINNKSNSRCVTESHCIKEKNFTKVLSEGKNNLSGEKDYKKFPENKNLENNNEDNYKFLDNQIKDMQNEINKLTLESSDREGIYETRKKFMETTNRNWIPNLKKSEDNIMDIVNMKNSTSMYNRLTPNETNYKSFLKERNEKELQKYLFSETEEIKSEINTVDKENLQKFGDDQNENLKIEMYDMNSENKINLIENKITNMECDINSMKLKMNTISESIQSLLETKTLLNKNNMNFVLDKCKMLIENNFDSREFKEKTQRSNDSYTNPGEKIQENYGRNFNSYEKSNQLFIELKI